MSLLKWVIIFLPSCVIADSNCLRANPGVIDADFTIVNRFENRADVTILDVAKHVALFSTRFKRGHEWFSLSTSWINFLGKGLSLYRNETNESFELFLVASPGTLSSDIKTATRLYKEDYDTIVRINKVNKGLVAGLYVGDETKTDNDQLEALEFVFGSKHNATVPIGASYKDCYIPLQTKSALKYLQRLDFLTCNLYITTNTPPPDQSADGIIQTCQRLQDLAISINITAEIMCRTSYPSFGKASNGLLGSVLNFQQFWCRIVQGVTQTTHNFKIILSSAFDNTPSNYKDTDTNLHDAKYYGGWWRRRDTISYEASSFVEKVEELEGIKALGNCSADCDACSSSEDCCTEKTCDVDNSFQPFEKGPPIRVCQSIRTSCAPRTPTTSSLMYTLPALPVTTMFDVIGSGVNLVVVLVCLGLLITFGICSIILYRRRKGNHILTKLEVRRFFNGWSNSEREFFGRGLETHNMDVELPYDKQFEVTEQTFGIYKNQLLGFGAFGIVVKGHLGKEDVAVKSTLPGVDKVYFKSLMLELKVLMYLGQHENIVNLRGSHTSKLASGKLYLFLEFCPLGCLHEFLRSHREKFSYVQDSKHTFQEVDDSLFTFKDILKWSIQIACAMGHLATKKVVHADIAARNILVFSREQVKLTDFGLSRRLYEYSNYVKKGQEPLPWRHMSVESLLDMTFSVQSDVWSFGVTLWEMFSLGNVPYPGYSLSQNFAQLLIDGLRLECPRGVHPLLYEAMTSCWTTDVKMRPLISQVHAELVSALDVIFTQQLYLRPSDMEQKAQFPESMNQLVR